MIGPGAARRRRASSTSTSPTASTNGPPRIWPASPASSRSTAMAPIRRWPWPASSFSRSAGRGRRKFFDIQAASPAPIAAEALARVGALYAIERDIQGMTAAARRAARQARAKPILDAMKPWLEAKLAAVSGKSTIAEAIRYALSRWEGLTRYLADGRIEIDNNVVERGMRTLAMRRP